MAVISGEIAPISEIVSGGEKIVWFTAELTDDTPLAVSTGLTAVRNAKVTRRINAGVTPATSILAVPGITTGVVTVTAVGASGTTTVEGWAFGY